MVERKGKKVNEVWWVKSQLSSTFITYLKQILPTSYLEETITKVSTEKQ